MLVASRPRSSAVVAPMTAIRRSFSTEKIRQAGALPEFVVAHHGVVRRGPQHGGRRVLVASHDQLRGRDLRGHAREQRQRLERLGIREGQRLTRTGRAEGPALLGGTRVDGQEVGPKAGEAVGDVLSGTLADRDERHHGRDADDHTEHRESRSEPAGAKAIEGQPDDIGELHAATRPSRIWIWREAWTATSGSCVMSTIVRPVWCS